VHEEAHSLVQRIYRLRAFDCLRVCDSVASYKETYTQLSLTPIDFTAMLAALATLVVLPPDGRRTVAPTVERRG
jgi:hypothetical protein